jgi:hypothetical protein
VNSEFTAFGSGAIEGQTLSGKSTHVLTQAGGDWLSAKLCSPFVWGLTSIDVHD